MINISHIYTFDHYRIVPNVQCIPLSPKWKFIPLAPIIITLPDPSLSGKSFRVLAKYKKNIPALQYTGRVTFATVAITIGALGGTSVSGLNHLYIKHPKKIYLAYYANGNHFHAITNQFTRTMNAAEFSKLYRGYSSLDKPGIANGMVETSLTVRNYQLLKHIIETFGDNYLNKNNALNDLAVAATTLVVEKRLSVDFVKTVIELLVSLGADLNEVSTGPSEIRFEKFQCNHHTSVTVLDSLYCKFLKLKEKKWTELQPIFKLIASKGGVLLPGQHCQRKISINSTPTIKYIQVPTPGTLPKEVIH
jgi:hypothetical protein